MGNGAGTMGMPFGSFVVMWTAMMFPSVALSQRQTKRIRERAARPESRYTMERVQRIATLDVPHPEFIDIPPDGASFVTVYTTARARVPQFIELDAIDHVDWQLSNQQ